MKPLFAILVACVCVVECAHGQTGLPLKHLDEDASKVPKPKVIQIFADGNLRKAVSEATTLPAATEEEEGTDGGARLGVALLNQTGGDKHSFAWSGVISIASTAARVSENFVATVLTPGSGKGFQSGLIEYRQHHRFSSKILDVLFKDVHLYGTAAASDWDSAGSVIKAVTYGVGALRVVTPIHGTLSESDVGLSLEFGPAFRSIGGDVTMNRHDVFRSAAVGTVDQNFFGVEVGMQVHVKEITAGIQIYKFFTGNAEVPGLSKSQLIASINVRGPLFGGPAD